MPNLVITVAVPKHWKAILLASALSGTLLGGYVLWRRFKSADTTSSQPIVQPVNLQFQSLSTRQPSPSVSSYHQTYGDKASLASHLSFDPSLRGGSTSLEETPLSDLDVGRLGLRTLGIVVDNLEFLMSRQHVNGTKVVSINTSSSSSKFINELRILLEQTYQLREQYRQRLVLDDPSSVSELFDSNVTSEDDTLSFVSAVEQIDLSDIEIEITSKFQFPLYQAALREVNDGNVTCRALRTDLVGCERDFEYLAKLHCLRQAFNFILTKPQPLYWMRELGRLHGMRFLFSLGYPTSDYEEAYDKLIQYILDARLDPDSSMLQELEAKNVTCVNFYDILFDLVLLDSLELLASPPSSILAVTRHRWLTDNFKQVALESAIWTILAAKRQLLLVANGFQSHYYALVGTISPALAWGFLGSNDNYLRLCSRFRDLIMSFLRQSFQLDRGEQSTLLLSLLTSSFMVGESEDASTEDVSLGLPSDDNDDDQSAASMPLATSLSSNNNSNNDPQVVVDDDDGSSTIVADKSSPPSPKSRLRYTTLNDLASDLYELLGQFASQSLQLFLEESERCGNPLPDYLKANPVQPVLCSSI